jgi:hypothetical protein
MDETNDHLPIDKPTPMKRTDWILLAILIVLLLVALPFIWVLYMPIVWALIRFLIPLAALGFIIYFAIRFTQIGKIIETGSDDTSRIVSKIWIESIAFIRKAFRPIAYTIISVLVIGVLTALLVKQFSKGSDTEKEMSRIALGLAKYKNAYGQYPADLAELIGNDPLKREWLQDTWGNGMEYTRTKNGTGYKLSSPGADRKSGTTDDLILEE